MHFTYQGKRERERVGNDESHTRCVLLRAIRCYCSRAVCTWTRTRDKMPSQQRKPYGTTHKTHSGSGSGSVSGAEWEKMRTFVSIFLLCIRHLRSFVCFSFRSGKLALNGVAIVVSLNPRAFRLLNRNATVPFPLVAVFFLAVWRNTRCRTQLSNVRQIFTFLSLFANSPHPPHAIDTRRCIRKSISFILIIIISCHNKNSIVRIYW